MIYKMTFQFFAFKPLSLFYIFISYIQINVATLYEGILTYFKIYIKAISTFVTLFVKYIFFRIIQETKN